MSQRVRNWQRERTIAKIGIDDAAWEATLTQFPFLDALNNDEACRLRELAALFIDSKQFVGANDFELTDEIVLAIAAQACLPILNLDLALYEGWQGIIVYQGEVRARREVMDEAGVMHVYDEDLSGEAMPGGPVVLSWEDVRMAGDENNLDYNVVVHEFAHKIDMLTGVADGMPPWLASFHSELPRVQWEEHWSSTMQAAYDNFCTLVERIEAPEIEGELPLDPYAALHPTEFFAVASESFFCAPDVLHAAYPALYDLLVHYYRQSPLERMLPTSSTDA